MTQMKLVGIIALLITTTLSSSMQGQVWVPDQGDGTYINPVLFADYSDPDVVRVGSDFYMVSSSFNCSPALPILHSTDLVNWTIVNHVFTQQPPTEVFDSPQHGNGVWAPSIRFHEGWYYIYYGDPDFGIYMCRTQNPLDKWEGPHLVRAAKGWIDPCPFWDDDGKAYLVHAFAGSRAGVKSIVVLHEMSADGRQLLDDGVMVFDGHVAHSTIEGTKMYKRNGFYYIFAPAGGVSTGWQTVLRSKTIYGPYEDKIVLHQGNTKINGPHQGAWVELENGEDWFLHFQELQPYGRIVHLQPATWKNDWLVVGDDADGDGVGEPVLQHQKPGVAKKSAVVAPQTSDEFNTAALGLQWQWQANPKPEWAFGTMLGFLRLNPLVLDKKNNLWQAPNLLLQKFPAETFSATTKLTFHHHFNTEKTGLVVMGRDYAYIALEQVGDELMLIQRSCMNAESNAVEESVVSRKIEQNAIELRVNIEDGGMCTFAYRTDDGKFIDFGSPFQAREGKWIGAKVGLFCMRTEHENDGGYVDVDWFRIEKNEKT